MTVVNYDTYGIAISHSSDLLQSLASDVFFVFFPAFLLKPRQWLQTITQTISDSSLPYEKFFSSWYR